MAAGTFSFDTFFDKHPGGETLLRTAMKMEDKNVINMLLLSYHITKDPDKICKYGMIYNVEQQRELRDCEVPSRNSITKLYEDINGIFLNVKQKYYMHEIIYSIYCFVLTLIFIYNMFVLNMFYERSIFRNSFIMFIWLSYSFSVFHYRNHCGIPTYSNICGNKIFLNIVNKIHDILDNIFCDNVVNWIYNHNLNHHILTNTPYDKDVYQTYPFLKLHPNDNVFKYYFFHKFQKYYIVLILGLSQFDRIWGHLNKKRNGNKIYILLYYSIFIILPFYFNYINSDDNTNGYLLFFKYVLNYFVIKFCGSVFMVYLFLISHNTLYNPHETNINLKNYDKWVQSQIEESCSFHNNKNNIIDYIFTLVFGGINLQIEHHVAPALCPIYYLFASNDIKLLCIKYNIEYTETGNFLTSIQYFHQYLFEMGNGARNHSI